MENATEALIMAGSVLLLVIALTVTISSLTTLRVQTQDLLDDRDQLLATQDEAGYINYLQNDIDKDVRTVGIETIVTSIRRMTKEDYTIYIKPKSTINGLNNKYDDMKVDVDGNNNSIKLTISGVGNRYVSEKNFSDVIGLIYENLENGKFKERTGIYQNKTSEGVSEANKSTYKIITYEQI